MLLFITCIVFFISNVCLATVDKDPKNSLFPHEECKLIGDKCQENNDCCSDLNCYSIPEDNVCLPASINRHGKRNSEDSIIPPYYNPKNQLYPYGISKPSLPFHKAQESKQASEGKQLEWNHCQFHEDCGEGNCCHVHFRFRSLPKWFCRPNGNDRNELCQPLTKYRSHQRYTRLETTKTRRKSKIETSTSMNAV